MHCMPRHVFDLMRSVIFSERTVAAMHLAVCTPSIEAEDACEVLADLLVASGALKQRRRGNPEGARWRLQCAAFAMARNYLGFDATRDTDAAFIYAAALKQRATFRWVAAPTSELVIPATALSGLRFGWFG